jgi:hypothetical protein
VLQRSVEAVSAHLSLTLLFVHPLIMADLTEQIRARDELAVAIRELGFERNGLPLRMFGDIVMYSCSA